MATITSSSGTPLEVNARRTESLDSPRIKCLVTTETNNLFGVVNIINLIEKALLAVTLTGEDDEIIAHAAFYDYPNIKGVDPGDWEEWMFKNFECPRATALNSLFMHHFVAQPDYAASAAKEIIRTVYNAAPAIHYIFLMTTSEAGLDSSLTEIFLDVSPSEKGSSKPIHGFLCNRHEFMPVLHIRSAQVEDNDDLAPIFNSQSDILRKTYGDYFLAELIEAQTEKMQCLAAEVDGYSVGFMSVCQDVNLDVLNSCFELGAFHGLRKAHPDDTVKPKTPSLKAPSIKSGPSVKTAAESEEVQIEGKLADAHMRSGTPSEAGGEEKEVEEGQKSPESQDVQEKVDGEVTDVEAKQATEDDVTDIIVEQDKGEEARSKSSVASEDEVAEVADVSSVASVDQQESSKLSSVKTSDVTSISSKSTAACVKETFMPTYYGESNTVVIQLFAIDERYEMRSLDFMPKVFELFPDRDFAVITVPHLVPEFPLLQNFIRITPRPTSTLAHELYVFNKGGLLSTMKVRKAGRADTEGVENLVSTLKLNAKLLEDLEQYHLARRDVDGTELQAFVAECVNQIVGVAIIRKEENIEYVRSHYNIEDFIYFNHHRREEHGHIFHLALNPVFHHLTKTFVKEILRQGHKTCLYYPVYPSYGPEELASAHSLITALGEFVPVRARRQIDYPLKQLGSNAPSERILTELPPYALSHINRKLIMEPKVTINARIVVVGASTVGLTFLETLLFCPHLRFNNLTLISPHGITRDLAHDDKCCQILGTNHCFTHKDFANTSFRSMVNVVYGKMTALNRKKKQLTVNNKFTLPYDHLMLCSGTQYQVPCPTEADISQLLTTSEVPYSPNRRYTGQVPMNLFTINDEVDAKKALDQVEKEIVGEAGKIIVYGNSLEAYCCLQVLMTIGVTGDRLVLVKPPAATEVTPFNNPDIDDTIAQILQGSGVTIKEGFLLAQWNDGEKNPKEIRSVSFTSDTKPLRLDCVAMFSYYKRLVDYDCFKAINEACLVFDSRLVVDANFHTNDASIRGAGSLTKFQRIYYADQWTHARFNSRLVGEELAKTVLRLFDPILEPALEPPPEELKLIPLFEGPKIQGGILPGGYNYLHIGKPILDIPLMTLMVQNDYGNVLTTGSPGGSPDYFRLHLNQYNAVETITCFSKNPFSVNNIIWLYGIHERILNNVASRFKEGLIPDLYDYFNQTWSLGIYHDRFSDFKDEIRELLLSRPSADQMALEEQVRKMIEEDLGLSDQQRRDLKESYQVSGAKRAVETRLLSFISYNYYHLPMYAKPGLV